MPVKRSKNGRRVGHIIGNVYLVHLKRAVNGAQHYLGFSTNISERVQAHRKGRGAPLLGEASRRGTPWRVVRIWRRKDGYFEQALKRKYALKDLCPACGGPQVHKRKK